MTVGKGADKQRHYCLAKEKRIFKLLVKDGQGRGQNCMQGEGGGGGGGQVRLQGQRVKRRNQNFSADNERNYYYCSGQQSGRENREMM